MKNGKYRILVTRHTEVQITVAYLSLFQEDFQKLHQLGEDPDAVTEEDFLAARAIMSISGSTSEMYNRGLTIIHLYSDQHVDHIQTCRHCGCTDYNACSLSTGPCSWVAEDVCSNPFCVALETAQAEKEQQS